MLVARILSPVHSLGPGNRVCIWTQGCKKRCKGCISPELQPFTGTETDEMLLSDIVNKIAEKNACKGITISGGEPFEQSKALLRLVKLLRNTFDDILVYTGFEFKDIQNEKYGLEASLCLDYIDVLIDGEYIEELNYSDCVMKGSTNQKIHFLNKKLISLYEEYMEKGRILQSFVHNTETVITGIKNREAYNE